MDYPAIPESLDLVEKVCSEGARVEGSEGRGRGRAGKRKDDGKGE